MKCKWYMLDRDSRDILNHVRQISLQVWSSTARNNVKHEVLWTVTEKIAKMAILLIGQMNSLFARQEVFLIFLILSSKPSFCSKGWSDNSVPRGGLSLKDLADSEGLTKLFASDGYFTDTSQENVKPFGGIKIQYEAQKLSASLRWISNDEIGVTTMQVCFYFRQSCNVLKI